MFDKQNNFRGNRNHLQKLITAIDRKDISIWNKFISEQDNEFKADLKGAFLTNARLARANLQGADLSEANLRGAYLNGANLNGACLEKANLNGAFLNGAFLIKSRMSGVKLIGARLIRAHLIETDLSGADMRVANINGIALYKTNLDNVKMKGIICDYIYCDKKAVKKKKYKRGEFEVLYSRNSGSIFQAADESGNNQLNYRLLCFDLQSNWQVHEFLQFLSIINKIYNFVYAINDFFNLRIKNKDHAEKTKSIISNEWPVPKQDQLKISSIEIHSTGKMILTGVSEVIRICVEVIRTIFVREKIEKPESAWKATGIKELLLSIKNKAKISCLDIDKIEIYYRELTESINKYMNKYTLMVR